MLGALHRLLHDNVRYGWMNSTRTRALRGGTRVLRKGKDPLDVVRAPGWDLDWLIHGFSTRVAGKTTVYRPGSNGHSDLNLGFTEADDRDVVAANRGLFVDAIKGDKEILGLVTLRQIHSSVICKVQAKDVLANEMPAVLKGDGLMTGEPGALLGIQTADCIPVLLADKQNRVVAAFHAGWRGTLARIVEQGVGRMRLEFGSKPEHLIASIGPGIGQCCYAIGQEVREQFESQFAYAPELFREVYDSDPIREKYPMLFLTARAPGHSDIGPSMHLDLAEANRRQLLAAGLKKSAIFLTGQCTGCHTDRFFSHRMEQGFTGRMMSVIGIARSKS
jgi:YfiH family protein